MQQALFPIACGVPEISECIEGKGLGFEQQDAEFLPAHQQSIAVRVQESDDIAAALQLSHHLGRSHKMEKTALAIRNS